MKVRELIERLEQLDVIQEDEIFIDIPGQPLHEPKVELYPAQKMVVLR